jgi:AcrR family transcriptional regulator
VSEPTSPEYEPVQKRSRRTRDRLIEALESLLREGSFEAATVADIADRAGVSVGAVYRRFRNKDAFIPVLFELYFQRLAESAGGRPPLDPEAGLREALRVQVRAAWAFIQEEGHILRAVQLYSRRHPELVGDEWDALRKTAREGTRQLLEVFRSEVGRDDLDHAAQMVAYLLNTALLERGLYPEMGISAGMTVSEDDFLDGVADFAWAWLRRTEPGEP